MKIEKSRLAMLLFFAMFSFVTKAQISTDEPPISFNYEDNFCNLSYDAKTQTSPSQLYYSYETMLRILLVLLLTITIKL